MDFEERLNWIDEHYLSQFDALSIDSEIPMQQPFDEMRHILREYPVAEEDPGQGCDLPDVQCRRRHEPGRGTFQCVRGAGLRIAVFAGSGAEAGIAGCGDRDGYHELITTAVSCQPTYSIIAKNANAEDEDAFCSELSERRWKRQQSMALIKRHCWLGSIRWNSRRVKQTTAHIRRD